jgi:hypothetical protein
MPQMSRIIEGCGYNPEVHVLAFRFKDMGITVERDRILISKVENEAEVRRLMDWLRYVVNSADADIT